MRIAICDDEKNCRDNILNYLKPYIQKDPTIIVVEFDCGEDLILDYENGNNFNIIFLDIQMKNIDGVETAKKFRQFDKSVILIFITSFVNFIADTFRVGAFQFLLKPVKQDDFTKDFERALLQHKINHYLYKVKCKEKTFAFEVKDIMYIESYNRHLFVVTYKQTAEFVGKLIDEEKKLTNYNFVRCHQGFLINMNYIKLIKKTSILLKNESEIPMSKHLRTSVMIKFNNYLSGCSI